VFTRKSQKLASPTLAQPLSPLPFAFIFQTGSAQGCRFPTRLPWKYILPGNNSSWRSEDLCPGSCQLTELSVKKDTFHLPLITLLIFKLNNFQIQFNGPLVSCCLYVLVLAIFFYFSRSTNVSDIKLLCLCPLSHRRTWLSAWTVSYSQKAAWFNLLTKVSSWSTVL
jgi:hypothetical protein